MFCHVCGYRIGECHVNTWKENKNERITNKKRQTVNNEINMRQLSFKLLIEETEKN